MSRDLPLTGARIAVVITCRDLGRMLPEAVASVERQTIAPSEIVIVDGGSTDVHTCQVLHRLERRGLRVVRSAGGGASLARNAGASLTSAEYLTWLDADDTFEPRYLEAAGAPLDADPELDFVSCAMRAFGDASYVWKPSPPTFVEAVATGGVPHASTLVRRRLWESVGGFDESLESYELLDFWASVMARGFRGVVLDEPLLNYRIRPGSGYRRSLLPDTYRARLRHFYEKHRHQVHENGLELVRRKEAFFISQREYRTTLESRAAALETELTSLHASIHEAVVELERRGMARVEWGDLGAAVSRMWGRDRGTAVDRHYIEAFLNSHHDDVRGRVLEVRDSIYTTRIGGDRVTGRDVIDIDPANSAATIVADLRRADGVPSDTYDCIILTQTLHLVDDMPAVVAECFRMLKPDGTLLVTAPSVIGIDGEAGVDGDYWRLTEASALQLFAKTFPPEAFDVSAYGNVKACTAFLHGVSAEEIPPDDLARIDPACPLVIAVRAVKPTRPAKVRSRSPQPAGAIVVYHRIAELHPDAHGLCTPPAVFRAHMKCLRDQFQPIALGELAAAVAAGRIPDRAVAVTLDDGYLDALTVASPIVAEFDVPATFFVNTDRLDEPHERWWDMLERVLRGSGEVPPRLSVTVAGREIDLPTANGAERVDALERLNELGWAADACTRQRIADAVVAWSGSLSAPRDTHRVLTGAEIRALASRPGHTIGAHTTHHLALTTHSRSVKQEEVFENKRALETLLGTSVGLFSYPYGDLDVELTAVVAQAGFAAAVTVERGLVTAGVNPLLMPRYETGSLDAAAFAALLDSSRM